MTTGTVLFVTHDGTTVTGKVRVEETTIGIHDYTAELDYATWNALPDNDAKLEALVDEWNIVRDAYLAEVGTVTKISTWNDDSVTLT